MDLQGDVHTYIRMIQLMNQRLFLVSAGTAKSKLHAESKAPGLGEVGLVPPLLVCRIGMRTPCDKNVVHTGGGSPCSGSPRRPERPAPAAASRTPPSTRGNRRPAARVGTCAAAAPPP